MCGDSLIHSNENKDLDFSKIINNAAKNILSIHHVYINILLVYVIATSVEISTLLLKVFIPPTEGIPNIPRASIMARKVLFTQ